MSCSLLNPAPVISSKSRTTALMRSSSRAERRASTTSRTSVSPSGAYCEHYHCAARLALRSRKRQVELFTRELIDKHSAMRDDECGRLRDQHPLADGADEEQQKESQQQDQVQQPAQPIEAAPNTRHD